MNVVILVFTLALSTNVYAQQGFSEIEKYEEFDSWVYDAFPIGPPTTEGTILSLGSITGKSEENYSVGHAANPLKLVTYKFDGLVVNAIVEKTKTKNAYITKISIFSGRWSLSNGITVGQDATVLSSLSIAPEENTYNYCGVNNCIEFQLTNGVINAINIDLYVD